MEFGETIKKIRRSQRLSQQDLAKGVMSRSNLLRFESGQYYPSYDKVFRLIAKLGLSLEEVLYIANDYQAKPLDVLQRKLVEYDNQYDLEGLKEISKEAKQSFQETANPEYQTLYWFAQLSFLHLGHVDELPEEAIKGSILPYFEDKEDWYLKDLRFLNNSLAIFELDDACFLGNRALKSFEKYQQFNVQTNLQSNLMINLGTRCFEEKRYSESLSYFQRAKAFSTSFNHVYNQIICAVYLLILEGGATEQLETYLATLELLGYHETVAYLRQVKDTFQPSLS